MTYNNKTSYELKNTIKVSDYDGGEFVATSPGRQLLGLVKIKNVELDTEWGKKDAYRFVFKAKANGGIVTTDCTAACAKRSNLYKLVSQMAGGAMPKGLEKDANALFSHMEQFVGGWFDAVIEHNEWSPKDNPEKVLMFTKLATIMPADPTTSKSLGLASEYFKKETAKQDVSGSKASVDTGFEDMADAGSEGDILPDGYGRFKYEIIFAKDKASQVKQTAFLESVGAKYNDNTKCYHTGVEVPALEKKFKGFHEPIGIPEFDNDPLPFD